MVVNINNVEMQYRERQRSLAADIGFKRLLPINKDNFPEELFNELWEQARKADYAFEDTTRDDVVRFLQSMLPEGTYNFEIPGEVFVQLVNAFPGSDARVHFLSLSTGPTAPLLEASRELFWFAFDKIGVSRVTATIPEFNKKVERMATLLHMKFEGSIRKAFLYNDERWNLLIYGMLDSEWRKR